MAILKRIGKRMIKFKRGKSLGQGMVEFGIILPIVLTSFFTIIELGRLYHAWVAVENGARFGVRYAITGEFDSSNCTGSCDDEAEEESARVDTIKEVIWGGSETIIRKNDGSGNNSDQGFFNTTICDPDNLVGPASQFDTYTCSSGEDAGEPGDEVAVIVEYNHPIIVPLVSNIIPQIRLTAERQSIVETFRITKSDSAPGYSPPPPPPAMTAPPTSTPAPTESAAFDYCAEIYYYGDNHSNDSNQTADPDVIFWDQSRFYDEMWKFAFEIFNNNDIDMYMTDYYVDWTEGSSTIDLLYGRYGSSNPPSWTSHKFTNKYRSGPAPCYTSASSPKRHCDPNSNIVFLSRPGCDSDCYPQEIYNMFCKDYNDCQYDSGEWANSSSGGGVNAPITGSNYSFYAWAEFTFYPDGEDPVVCTKEWNASGNAPDHPGGGGGSYDPPDPAESSGGGGGGGGGGSPTPDPSSPDD